MGFIFGFLLLATAAFLIMIVLLQRGRGGGLAGAFGGMGGQSAFGAKAGDLFTRITIGVAAFWILLCILAVKVLSTPGKGFAGSDTSGGGTSTTATGPAVPGTAKTGSAAKTGTATSGSSAPAEKPAPAPQSPSGSGSDSSKSAPPAPPTPPATSGSTASPPAVPPTTK